MEKSRLPIRDISEAEESSTSRRKYVPEDRFVTLKIKGTIGTKEDDLSLTSQPKSKISSDVPIKDLSHLNIPEHSKRMLHNGRKKIQKRKTPIPLMTKNIEKIYEINSPENVSKSSKRTKLVDVSAQDNSDLDQNDIREYFENIGPNKNTDTSNNGVSNSLKIPTLSKDNEQKSDHKKLITFTNSISNDVENTKFQSSIEKLGSSTLKKKQNSLEQNISINALNTFNTNIQLSPNNNNSLEKLDKCQEEITLKRHNLRSRSLDKISTDKTSIPKGTKFLSKLSKKNVNKFSASLQNASKLTLKQENKSVKVFKEGNKDLYKENSHEPSTYYQKILRKANQYGIYEKLSIETLKNKINEKKNIWRERRPIIETLLLNSKEDDDKIKRAQSLQLMFDKIICKDETNYNLVVASLLKET